MPESGPTFTDWAQLDADRSRPLLVDEDFSWSEPPARRRRSGASVAVAERPRATARRPPRDEPAYQPEPAYESERGYESDRGYESERGYESVRAYRAESAHQRDAASIPIELERELDAAWGGRLSAPPEAETYEVVPYSFEHDHAAESGRRTVVITGRGSGYYSVTRRRSRDADLSFHERAAFSPDRTAMWAVLLGLALLIGCIAH